jgi:hypothetical protein
MASPLKILHLGVVTVALATASSATAQTPCLSTGWQSSTDFAGRFGCGARASFQFALGLEGFFEDEHISNDIVFGGRGAYRAFVECVGGPRGLIVYSVAGPDCSEARRLANRISDHLAGRPAGFSR